MKYASRLLVLLTLPVLGLMSGCQLLAPLYLAALMMGYDTRKDPDFKFPEDAKRIAVITYIDLDTQMDLGHFDQDLNEVLARKLFDGFGEGKEVPQVIKASKVAKWQDEHPDWPSMEPSEIGKALKADYIIYLEVDKISFYEDGPSKAFYRGKAEIGLTVVRVESEEVVYGKDIISIQVPKNQPIPVTPEIPPLKFRREFIRRMADRVSWVFLPHDTNDEFPKDPI